MLLGARLQVSACRFIAPSSEIGDMNLITMYGDACSLIELATELDQEEGLAEFGDTVSNLVWSVAAFMILRLGKSHVGDALDSKRGQRAYFSTIHLYKKQSVRSDDLTARATIILSQLWTSKLVIRQPDGTPDSLWLRCRNRLGLSMTWDCFWLWRQEFGGQPNPYEGVEGIFHPQLCLSHHELINCQDELKNSTGKPGFGDSPGMGSNNLMGIGWSPETLFQGFQWPFSDDFSSDNWPTMMGVDQPS